MCGWLLRGFTLEVRKASLHAFVSNHRPGTTNREGPAVGCACGPVAACRTKNRLQDGVYKEFTSAVADLSRKLRLGDGLHPATTLGPLISPAAVDRVSLHWQCCFSSMVLTRLSMIH